MTIKHDELVRIEKLCSERTSIPQKKQAIREILERNQYAGGKNDKGNILENSSNFLSDEYKASYLQKTGGLLVNASGPYEETLLTTLARQPQPCALELVRYLVNEEGAYVNLAKSNGTTALHVAARSGNVAMAHLLLELGANPNQATGWFEDSTVGVTYPGTTPLHTAIRYGHVAMVNTLIDFGADLTRKIDFNSDSTAASLTCLGWATRVKTEVQGLQPSSTSLISRIFFGLAPQPSMPKSEILGNVPHRDEKKILSIKNLDRIIASLSRPSPTYINSLSLQETPDGSQTITGDQEAHEHFSILMRATAKLIDVEYPNCERLPTDVKGLIANFLFTKPHQTLNPAQIKGHIQTFFTEVKPSPSEAPQSSSLSP